MKWRYCAVVGAIVTIAVIFLKDPLSAQSKPDSGPDSQPTSKPKEKEPHPGLLDPKKAQEKAPATFKAKFETTKGDFVIEVHRDWAPLGADRFYNLVKIGYFENIAVFRVIPNFMAQFGIHGDPKVTARWRNARIKDDPVKQSNQRGYISFAMAGPNTRTTQLFINFQDNSRLDGMGFAPFGKVVHGMKVVDEIYKVGEGAPRGPGPNQGKIMQQGNRYLKSSFPKLDYIKSASLVK